MSNENKKQNYQIISLIGQGAYGQVYKARKKFTGQFVAIKSIKKKGKQEKDIKAMRQEIDILKKLKHQNIILLLDSFETQSEFILVTELGQGELFNIIEDDQYLEIQQIRKIAQQLVRALHYIHSNRITHRDMKPQNILMTSDGVIKLCDFGFARSMSYKTQVLTSLKGTPLYMAPEVVKQEPYNHTADLWSLGVILFELATGNPPFTAPNLITLVQHISKDPILYPESINGDFKNFLKGLLNKDPKRRLGWPELLHHAFIRETETQKNQRKRKTQKFSSWIEDNVICQDEQSNKNNPNSVNSKYVPGNGFQQKNTKDVSPKKQTISGLSNNLSTDSVWNKYLTLANEQKGAQQLRSDGKFLQSFLQILETSVNEIIRVKQKRQSVQIAIKTMIQVLMKSKTPQSKKMDIAKNFNIPDNTLKIMKMLLKIDNGKQYIETISEIIKLVGLLAKITFQKSLGIEMVYIRTFIPAFPQILKSIYQSKDSTYVNNFLRTIGIFANNASANHIRSFSFYREIVEIKLIPESIQILKHFEDNINVLKLYVQVLSALIHPVFGDIECFPWKTSGSNGISEYKDFLTMSECVRQSIINVLLENSCIDLFQKILQLQDQSSILPKISIFRIILQSIRLSKDFTEAILLHSKTILKKLIQSLTNKDIIVNSTACCILTQCIKYMKQKQKQNIVFKQLTAITEIALNSTKALLVLSTKQFWKLANAPLGVHGSFLLLYQILGMDNPQNNIRVINILNSEKFFSICACLMFEPEKNKLEQMRKIEGSNYGIHSLGLYDSCFLLLHRLYIKITKDPNAQVNSLLFTNILKSRLSQKISMLVKTLSSKTDISPRGFVACLIFIGDLINLNLIEDFVEQNFIKSLIFVLKQNQVQAIVEWPPNFGGGQNCLTIIFGNLNIIILNLLRNSQKYPQIPKFLYETNLIQYIVSFAKFFNEDTINSVMSILSHLLVLDKIEKNQKMQKTFSYQFIQAGGMGLFNRFNLLNKDNYEVSALIDSCNFLSLLARASKQFYEHIDSICPFNDILALMNHQDSQLRGKVLNLIGNLCRHSSYFYKKLQEFGILAQSIKLCEDQDKTVKKFACVVLGNASFHDDSLYEALRPTIPILINLIKDSQQKTRSNAAAALGNLARNSTYLDKDFVKSGANFQLINLVMNEKSLSCKKVCVMAIMNLLSLPESKKILQSQNIEGLLKKYIPPTYNGDSGLIKACQKALEKLQKSVLS